MDEAVRQKIGQLFMVGFDALEVNAHIAQLIEQQRVGGVILFRRNVQSPQQLASLCRQLQEINARVSAIPLLIALDQEGGMVMRVEQGVTPIPAAMAFQAAGSAGDCEQLARISADEMRQLGINMILAPVLDVNNNPLNPVIGVRAYGEDPDTVIHYGMAAMRGMQAAGMITTAKHFPGHGDTATDSHYTMSIVPHARERLDAIELPPFKAAIAQGVDAIMTAHVVFPAIEAELNLPATLSKAVLSGLLRNEMQFDGVIISDCLEMLAIADGVGVTNGAIATLKAGADIALISHQQQRQHDAIAGVLDAVARGDLAIEQLEQSYQRVLRLKQMPAVAGWRTLSLNPAGIMRPQALALAQKVQAAALQVQGAFRPLTRQQPVHLITFEVRLRSEIDEAVSARNQEARSSMLPALQAAGFEVHELALSSEASDTEVIQALAFVQGAQQIVVQTYNAMLVPGQQRLVQALPHDKLWLVAGRLPYDLQLAPQAQGRLASFGCRPAALQPVVDKLAAILVS